MISATLPRMLVLMRCVTSERVSTPGHRIWSLLHHFEMPRQKRALQEVDGNSIDNPEPKRAATDAKPRSNGKSKGKKGTSKAKKSKGPDKETVMKNRAEYRAVCALCILSIRFADFLQEEIRMTAEAMSPKGLEYICVFRPRSEIRGPRDDDDDEYDEDEDDDELDTTEDERVAGKPLSDFPEWKWAFTRRGKYFAHMYTDEIDKSNPDCFGMYIYNDYAGYGGQEVIENQLNAFNDDFMRKECDAHALWAHIEAMGLCFFQSDLMGWYNLDDGPRVSATLQLIGKAVLTGLNALDRADLLKPDSKVKSIGLVLSFFLNVAENGGESMMTDLNDKQHDKPQDWPNKIVCYAKTHDIPLNVRRNFESTVEEFDTLKPGKLGRKEGEDRWGWKTDFKKFVSQYGKTHVGEPKARKIGGSTFSIFKMPKQQRIKHSFDKVDPLDVADPDGLFHDFE